VQHPHLITPIALGLTADGEPWLAMEWLDAKPLSVWLAEEGALSMTTIVEMFKQVADFLNYAHSQGEVHMNLKPSNILLVERPQGAFVKIADFGYAKMLMERELEMADEKAPARGSPLYMSPEQFKGTRIDSRSDIYSVACMMYECFYGRPPHQGVDLLETMDRHMHAEVTFPSEPELPEAAQEVLRMMLRKDSTERPRSIQEAMQLLESGLEGHFPKPEPRPEPAFADARGVDFITAKRGTAAKKGREPWMLLMGCVTVLLFVLIFQQCMVMIRDTTHGKHHGNQVKKVNPAN
jgi:eukaryotic-like serine/threonine-protein kinase